MTRQKEAAEREEQGGQVTSGNVHAADCLPAPRAPVHTLMSRLRQHIGQPKKPRSCNISLTLAR